MSLTFVPDPEHRWVLVPQAVAEKETGGHSEDVPAALATPGFVFRAGTRFVLSNRNRRATKRDEIGCMHDTVVSEQQIAADSGIHDFHFRLCGTNFLVGVAPCTADLSTRNSSLMWGWYLHVYDGLPALYAGSWSAHGATCSNKPCGLYQLRLPHNTPTDLWMRVDTTERNISFAQQRDEWVECYRYIDPDTDFLLSVGLLHKDEYVEIVA